MSGTDVLHLGVSARVTFQRAAPTREPGELPRGTGTYPLRWSEGPGGERTLTLPVGADEAVWLSLRAAEPTALQVIVDGIDAVSGGPAGDGLHDDPQDYVVVPDQRWLDGVGTSDDMAAQMLGPAAAGGGVARLTLVAHRLRASAFRRWWTTTDQDLRINRFGPGEGVRGGGEADESRHVARRLVPDPFGIEDWDPDPFSLVEVRVVDPGEW